MRRDKARGYSRRRDQWGRGLIPGQSPTYIGLLGETAAVAYLNRRLHLSLEVNLTDAPEGDDGSDVKVWGTWIQVKCRRRGEDMLIRAQAQGGRIIPFKADVYLQTTWDQQTQEDGSTVVVLDGWLTRKQVLGLGRFCPARRGKHKNQEVAEHFFQSMRTLPQFLKNRRESQK